MGGLGKSVLMSRRVGSLRTTAILTLLVFGSTLLWSGMGGQSVTLGATPYTIPRAKVVLGNFPVFDLTPWVAAEHWGYLKDLNLTLEHKVFPDERSGLASMAAGTNQLQLLGELTLIGVAPTFPRFRAVFVPNVFMGFAPLVRPGGPLKTYEEMKKTIPDPKEALRATAAQVKGKKWLMQLGASHEIVIDVVLELGGLTRKDVEIVDIGPAEGATAFLRGEGDIYVGDVPNRFRLQEEGMVPLMTAFDMGPKVYTYPTIAADLRWISSAANEDTLMRLMAAWYRAVDTLKAGGPKADDGFAAVANWVNKGAGTKFAGNAAKFIFTDIIPTPGADEVTKTFYTAGQSLNWTERLKWGIQTRESQGTIKPGQVDLAKLSIAEQLFRKYLDYKAKAEAGIAKGGPNAALAQGFLQQRDYLDAARVVGSP